MAGPCPIGDERRKGLHRPWANDVAEAIPVTGQTLQVTLEHAVEVFRKIEPRQLFHQIVRGRFDRDLRSFNQLGLGRVFKRSWHQSSPKQVADEPLQLESRSRSVLLSGVSTSFSSSMVRISARRSTACWA